MPVPSRWPPPSAGEGRMRPGEAPERGLRRGGRRHPTSTSSIERWRECGGLRGNRTASSCAGCRSRSRPPSIAGRAACSRSLGSRRWSLPLDGLRDPPPIGRWCVLPRAGARGGGASLSRAPPPRGRPRCSGPRWIDCGGLGGFEPHPAAPAAGLAPDSALRCLRDPTRRSESSRAQPWSGNENRDPWGSLFAGVKNWSAREGGSGSRSRRRLGAPSSGRGDSRREPRPEGAEVRIRGLLP